MIELKDYYRAQAETQPVPALQITNIPAKARSSKTKIIALAAAVFILLSGVTAVAYRSEIAERVSIRFGNSRATSVAVIDNNPRVSLSTAVWGMSEEYLRIPYGYTVFRTIDEARAAVPFDFKVPDIPAYLEFTRATSMRDEDGAHFYGVSFNFSEYGNPFNFDDPASMAVWPEWSLFISQRRVGPDAFLRVRSTGDIETVMIGEIEALGISYSGNLVELMFIYDGTWYHVSGGLKPGDLLAIANSLVN